MVYASTVRRVGGQTALGVLGIGAVTLACFPLHVNFAIPAFLYLLTVVLLSPSGGFLSSAVVSVIAVLCLDYFFTPPVLQLEIANPIDEVALATYLLTSLIITRLASDARQKASSAERRQKRFAQLYKVVWRLFSIEPQAISGAATLRIFLETLDVEGICVFDGSTEILETAGNPGPELVQKTRHAYESGIESADQVARTLVRCLYVAGKRIGSIGFHGLADADSMAAPLSTLAGAAMERADSFQMASSAAAISQVETLRTAIVDAFAHQFKTPLATILTAAGGIRETEGLTAQQTEMIELIESESVRLSRLATRLLVTARLDRAEVRPRLEPTRLSEDRKSVV
jgi:two-component system sensor histidine kinase KdpD